MTRIRTWVTSATTKGTNHYTITATGTDKNTSYFLRTLYFNSLHLYFNSCNHIIKGRWSESPTLTVPLKVYVWGEGEGGSKGHYLAVSQKSVINSKTTLPYLLYPSSCVYQYTLEVPMH